MSSPPSSQDSYLSQLELTNFRNITHSKINFSPNFNLLIGDNGQGKTNFLEAIALACSLKPLQALKNSCLIQTGYTQAHIKAQFGCETTQNLDLIIEPQGKRGIYNNNKIKSTSHYSKNFPIVSFIPHELLMITGSAQLRRRVLDQITASLFFEHGDNLRRYEKALASRNKILKDWPIQKNLLDTYSKLAIQEGAKIINFRLCAMQKINKFFSGELTNILGKNNNAEIFYFSQDTKLEFFAPTDIIGYLNSWYQKNSDQEFKRRVTLFGPHLDDLNFILNNLPAKSSASRGQTRALVLALKLAHLHAVTQIRDYPPIVILDDIISELDQIKTENLINLVQTLGLQVFFTATSEQNFLIHKYSYKTLNINSGTAVLKHILLPAAR